MKFRSSFKLGGVGRDQYRGPHSLPLLITRKMVPITGRASSFLVFLEFKKKDREEVGTEQHQQTYQFPQGYNILHRLQVHTT